MKKAYELDNDLWKPIKPNVQRFKRLIQGMQMKAEEYGMFLCGFVTWRGISFAGASSRILMISGRAPAGGFVKKAISISMKQQADYSPELNLIVRHERAPAGARVSRDGSAVHGAKTIRYGLEPVRDQFLQLGEDAGEFLQGLQDANSKNPGFHARYILHMKERYHADDINRALGHARRYHAYDCKSIERILAAKSTPRTLESIRNERAAKQLQNTLPKINQRSFADYSVLFTLHNQKEDKTREEPELNGKNQILSQNIHR